MKVYCIIDYHNYGGNLWGIYSTEELAKAALKVADEMNNPTIRPDECEIESWEIQTSTIHLRDENNRYKSVCGLFDTVNLTSESDNVDCKECLTAWFGIKEGEDT